MGTLVWWDMQTAPPPPNLGFLDHLLASHLAMHTGLFRLPAPRILRAHGNHPLPEEAHRCIVKRDLNLQQSISNGDAEHAMVVDILLWAVDQKQPVRDVVVISALANGAVMADVVTQLHLRNFNVVVASSFPPKDMTPLPPRPRPSLGPGEEFPSRGTIGLRCRSLVEECLRTGISAFSEHDFYVLYRSHHAESRLRCEDLEALLRESVPDVSFRSIVLATRPWILCTPAASSSPIQEMRVRQSAMISDLARARPGVDAGPLTMKEVSGWLQELVACGRADAGVNLSLLGKDFAEHHGGKKLNHKSLHCPSLMALIEKFDTIVRLERKDAMVILFPANNPVTPPPQIKRVSCTSIPHIVQVPGQISIRKYISPVPKFETPPVANRESCFEYVLPKEETPDPKPDSPPPQISSPPVDVAASDQTPTPAASPSPLVSSVASDRSIMDHLPTDFGAAAKNVETNGGAKFDYYSAQVVQEREAIKRTFQSVKRRLQEEFKKRKLDNNNNNNNNNTT